MTKQKSSEPLTDRELEEIEKRLDKIYNESPKLLEAQCLARRSMLLVWNEFCEQLSILANDNSLLVAEINLLKNGWVAKLFEIQKEERRIVLEPIRKAVDKVKNISGWDDMPYDLNLALDNLFIEIGNASVET